MADLGISTDKSAQADDDFEWADRSEYWLNYRPAKKGARKKFHYRQPLILCGHGISIRVDHNTLLIRQGLTHYPQKTEQTRFSPATPIYRTELLFWTEAEEFRSTPWTGCQSNELS